MIPPDSAATASSSTDAAAPTRRADPGSRARSCRFHPPRPGGLGGRTEMSNTSRPVAQVVAPEPVVEGASVHLRRSLGTRSLAHRAPSLLLDHFACAKAADYEAGFPY